MVNIRIVHNTASSFKFTLLSAVSFSKAILWLSHGEEREKLDIYDVASMSSETGIFSINASSGELSVDLNMLPLESIYYKDFSIQFLDQNDVEIDSTREFKISPEGKRALYGIVNKLTFDFNQLAQFSGVRVRLFKKTIIQQRCPECWDYELEQPISSVCSCGNKAYTTQDILCKKIKTQNKQQYDNTGQREKEAAMFQTYARIDFVKGLLFANLGTKEIYEVVDRNIANIGGIRTSTMFTGNLIKPNDARVKGILPLLD